MTNETEHICQECRRSYWTARRDSVYCAASCRAKAWRRQHPRKRADRRAAARRAAETKREQTRLIRCEVCNREIMVDGNQANQQYCSAACKQRAYRVRKQQREAQERAWRSIEPEPICRDELKYPGMLSYLYKDRVGDVWAGAVLERTFGKAHYRLETAVGRWYQGPGLMGSQQREIAREHAERLRRELIEAAQAAGWQNNGDEWQCPE